MDDMERLELSRITIIRTLRSDGEDTFTVEAVRPDGDGISLIESLGLLELAKVHLTAPSILSTPEEWT